MKKTLSLIMAVVMMLAVCVPAFAGEITNLTPDPQEVTVTTNLSAYTDSYTVTIPANFNVAWPTDGSDQVVQAIPGAYNLQAKLKVGSTLNIAVTTDGNMKKSMVNCDTLTLAVTANDTVNKTAGTYGYPVAEALTAPQITITGFNSTAPDTYTGTLTYTVTYAGA